MTSHINIASVAVAATFLVLLLVETFAACGFPQGNQKCKQEETQDCKKTEEENPCPNVLKSFYCDQATDKAVFSHIQGNCGPTQTDTCCEVDVQADSCVETTNYNCLTEVVSTCTIFINEYYVRSCKEQQAADPVWSETWNYAKLCGD